MHIAIDVTPLHSGHSGRGIGTYTRNLVSALASHEGQHTYSMFTHRQGIPQGADIVHVPYFDPFFLTLPLLKQKPTVVTVHDLIPLVFPDRFPAGLRGSLKWQIQKWSLRGAKRIVTDSGNSKDDIERICGIGAENIDVVYLAPDPSYRRITSAGTLAQVRKKFLLPKEYILYVGDVNWNKNIIGLLDAFDQLRTKKRYADLKLVLVGDAFLLPGLKEVREINRYVEDHQLERVVIRPGKVSLDSLAALYSMALAYVQPSFYEGFGLPVLEAFACGCPVVSTNVSSLREIAGPAILVSPSAKDLAEGMERAATADRENQVKRQYEWVKQFTWKQTANMTVRAYEKVLGAL